MAGVIDLPAQTAHRWKELRLNRDALNALRDWRMAILMSQHNAKPLPALYTDQIHDYLVMLVTQRQIERG